jgi:hypothetical protein
MTTDKSKPPAKRGRKSKIPDGDRPKIRLRLVAGESAKSIAREYGVDDKVIRRINKEAATEDGEVRLPVETIKEASEKSLANDLNDPSIRKVLELAGESDRDLFYSHKADLLEITLQLNLASMLSAQNAHKLAKMAQNHLSKIEDDAKLDSESRAVLSDAMALQASSNEAAKQPMKLFEIATKQPPPPPEDKPLRIIGGLPDKPYENG